MIEIQDQNLPGEYARMLCVLVGFLVVCCLSLGNHPYSAWLIPLFAMATLRGFGPIAIGNGAARTLFTSGILLGLVAVAVTFHKVSLVLSFALAMLLTLGLKIAAERTGKLTSS